MHNNVRIGLIDIVGESNANDRENIGLGTIAAYLRTHDVCVDLFSYTVNQIDDCIDRVGKKKYDSIGISLYSNTSRQVYRLARVLKRNGQKMIFVGGRLATAAADIILLECDAIDFVVLGYGEKPLLNCMQAIAQGKQGYRDPNIQYQKDPSSRGITNNDSSVALSTWPARDFLNLCQKHGNAFARINTSTGCLGNCSFCSNNSFTELTNRWRGRNSEDIFKEMKMLNSKWGVSAFVINDASFEDGSKDRIADLCDRIIKTNQKWAIRCSIRAESFEEKDILIFEKMKKAGFCNIFVGIEAGNNFDLKTFKKRATVEKNNQIINLLKKVDINYTLGFIMFNPYSTIEGIKTNIEYLLGLKSYRPDLYLHKAEVYYGSQLHNRLMQDSLLCEDFSIHSPFAYNYLNQNIVPIDRRLDVCRNDNDLMSLSRKLLELDYFSSAIKVLAKDTYDKYVGFLNEVREKSFSICKNIFYDQDIFQDNTMSKIDIPRTAIRSTIDKLDKLNILLLHDGSIRALLYRW